MATIIDGKATADALRVALAERVRDLSARFGRSPGLAVVLVGARADSATYVRNKKTACAAAGISDFGRDLPADASEADIVRAVEELNADPRVDGVLVQLPLPAHVNERRVLSAISAAKDADGLHPSNMCVLACSTLISDVRACLFSSPPTPPLPSPLILGGCAGAPSR